MPTTKPTKPKTKKSVSTKKASTTKKVVKSKEVKPNISDPKLTKQVNRSRKLLIFSLIILGLALLGYKFLPWFVPAIVNKKPITRLDVYRQMNKAYGQQTLDDLVNQAVLDNAIAKSGVKVDPKKVDQEVDKLKQQFAKMGGLDQILAQKGLTLEDLKKQIKTQLAVEEILKDKITPTDKEIKAEYDKNKDTLYKGKKFEEVKDMIANSLKQMKLSRAFLEWFAQAKKDIQVKYLAPQPSAQPTPKQ